MVSYLKLLANPNDSIALLRVINTPTRGIGRGTLDTIERIALETGLPLWQSIRHVVRGKLLPARAVAALQNFVEIIEDARAMLFSNFTERLSETATPEQAAGTEGDVSFSTEDAEDDATSFNFDEHEPHEITSGEFPAT